MQLRNLTKSDKLNQDQLRRLDSFYNSLHPKQKPPKPKVVKEPKPEQPIDHDLLTIHEVASYLRVNKETLKRWEKKGKIKSIRINSRGDRRYLKEEVQRLLSYEKSNKN